MISYNILVYINLIYFRLNPFPTGNTIVSSCFKYHCASNIEGTFLVQDFLEFFLDLLEKRYCYGQ